MALKLTPSKNQEPSASTRNGAFNVFAQIDRFLFKIIGLIQDGPAPPEEPGETTEFSYGLILDSGVDEDDREYDKIDIGCR